MTQWRGCSISIASPIPKLAGVLEDNSKLAAIEQSGDMGMGQKPGGPGPAQVRAYFSDAAGNAAKFLAQPDGPRVGALALRRLGHPCQ